MVPLFGLAGLALLAGLILFLVLVFLFIRNPSWRKIRKLLAAVSKRDQQQANQVASRMRGPVGKMLRVGVEHLSQPRELIEEVMYERVLVTRLWLRVALPIIAITAAAAPLLGLLGTVTGIINTFKMITVFGSGDVKSLSGGISEALITTKFGLIVAIPALLLHAILWLMSRSVTNDMELAAVALVNEVAKSRPSGAGEDDNDDRGGDDDDGGDPAAKQSTPDAVPNRPMVETVSTDEQPAPAGAT
jgi:biopolymer transport protein ExbB